MRTDSRTRIAVAVTAGSKSLSLSQERPRQGHHGFGAPIHKNECFKGLTSLTVVANRFMIGARDAQGLVPAGVDAEFSTSVVLPQHLALPKQSVAV